MCSYLTGVSRKFNNSSSRRDPFNRSKNGKMAYYVNEDMSISSKSIKTIEYYVLKFFKHKYKRRIAWCDICENKFKTIVKGKKIIINCPVCN